MSARLESTRRTIQRVRFPCLALGVVVVGCVPAIDADDFGELVPDSDEVPGSGGGTGVGGIPISGGAPHTGGVPGAGGDVGDGGTAGTAGPIGGDAGSGGKDPGAGGTGGDGGGPASACEFFFEEDRVGPIVESAVHVELRTAYTEFSNAYLRFGPSEDYGWRAPLDVDGLDLAGTLLGIPYGSAYSYEVVLEGDGEPCVSERRSSSQPLPEEPADLPLVRRIEAMGTEHAEGFLILTLNSDQKESWVMIRGTEVARTVWANQFGSSLSRARLSWDGKTLYAAESNSERSPTGGVLYSMPFDGSEEPTRHEWGTFHHDFVVAEDGNVYYLRKDPDSACDSVYHDSSSIDDISDDVPVLHLADFFDFDEGETNPCGATALQYDAEEGLFGVSVSKLGAALLFDKSGQVEWAFGDAVLAGGIATGWGSIGGLHYQKGKMAVFLHGSAGSSNEVGEASVFELNLAGTSFEPLPNVGQLNPSSVLGDVQMLEHGYFLVTSSEAGALAEIDPEADLSSQGWAIRTWSVADWHLGYTQHRASLYGAPPR